MAIKIALQTSTIEVTVNGKDAAGEKASMILGCKRYPIEESEKKLEEFQELISMVDGKPKHSLAEQNQFILDNVVYLRNIILIDEDEVTGEIKKLPPIKDTRKLKKEELCLLGDVEDAKEFLLKMHLDSAPWRLPIMLKLQEALLNRDLNDEFSRKN